MGISYDDITLDGMMELVDDNGDQKMQLAEFIRFMYICENSRPSDIKTVLFISADQDYSNTISAEEFHKIIQKFNLVIS